MTREPDEGNEAVASPSLSTNLDELAAVSPDSSTDADSMGTACADCGEQGFIYDVCPEESRCSEMDATNATSRDCVHVDDRELIETIISNLDELAVSDSTKYRYRLALEAALRIMGNIDPADWTEEQLREWAKKARTKSPCSIAVEFSAMKAYLMVRGRNDLLGIHWIWKLTGVGTGDRMREVSERIIPNKDLDLMLERWYEEANNPRVSYTRLKRLAVCLTFATTGIRSVGAHHIRVKDIDFERNRLNIYKTKKAKARIIPVDIDYMAVMRKYIDARAKRVEERGDSEELLEPTAPMFFKEQRGTEGAISSHSMSSIVSNESKKVTGKAYSAHYFRHAKATRMLREGFSEKQVQEYMGHVNFATTTIYVHLTADDLDRAYRTKNGNGVRTMEKTKTNEPDSSIDIAVEMLTHQFIAGNLDPDRYAAAVKALKQ